MNLSDTSRLDVRIADGIVENTKAHCACAGTHGQFSVIAYVIKESNDVLVCKGGGFIIFEVRTIRLRSGRASVLYIG
jgi:hypothetical protein